MFCDGVRHRLRFCLHHPNCVKMGAFQFRLLSGKQRKVGCLQPTVILFWIKKLSVEKGSVSRCFVMMQQSVFLSPKLGAKSWPIFMQSPQNVTVVCGIDCLDCQNELFVHNPLDVKENDEHALDFDLRPSLPFSHSVSLALRVWLMLPSPNACLIIARVSVQLFPRFAQNLMILLCGTHREIAPSRIHDSK
jgi:hypothetical protein